MSFKKSISQKTAVVALVATIAVVVSYLLFRDNSAKQLAIHKAQALEIFGAKSHDAIAKTFNQSPQIGFAFFGNMRGQALPCSCSFSPHGGVKRIKHIAQAVFAQNSDQLVLSSGNNFDNTEVVLKDEMGSPEDILRELYVPSVLTAANVARADLFRGLEWISANPQAKEVMISANLVDAADELIFKSHLDIERATKKITIVGLSSAKKIGDLKFKDPATALESVLGSAATKPDLVIILADLEIGDLRAVAARLKQIPSIILGSVNPWNEYEHFYLENSLWITNREFSKSVFWTQLSAPSLSVSPLIVGLDQFMAYATTYEKPNEELIDADLEFLDTLFDVNHGKFAVGLSRAIAASEVWDVAPPTR